MSVILTPGTNSTKASDSKNVGLKEHTIFLFLILIIFLSAWQSGLCQMILEL